MKNLSSEVVQELIKSVEYFRAKNSHSTICQIQLSSGYEEIGFNFCADQDHYDKGIGEGLAYDDCLSKLIRAYELMYLQVKVLN